MKNDSVCIINDLGVTDVRTRRLFKCNCIVLLIKERYFIGLYYAGPYWRNFRVIGEIKAGGKEASGKGFKQLSPKIQFLANILFLLNSNKTRVLSTGYSLGLQSFNLGVQRG